LMSQIATSRWGGRRKLPFAFTEHGAIQIPFSYRFRYNPDAQAQAC